MALLLPQEQLSCNFHTLLTLPRGELMWYPFAAAPTLSILMQNIFNLSMATIKVCCQHSGAFCRICLDMGNQCLSIKLTWSSGSWLIFEVLITLSKFFKPTLCCSNIYSIFAKYSTNIFSRFCCTMAKLEFIE